MFPKDVYAEGSVSTLWCTRRCYKLPVKKKKSYLLRHSVCMGKFGGVVNHSPFEEAVQALVPSSKLPVFDSRLDPCEWDFSFLDSQDNTLYSHRPRAAGSNDHRFKLLKSCTQIHLVLVIHFRHFVPGKLTNLACLGLYSYKTITCTLIMMGICSR